MGRGLCMVKGDVMYYGWFDDNPKMTAADKIQDAIDAYVRRFHKRPNVVLVNEIDVAEIQGMAVRAENFMRRNNFWVGYENAKKVAEPMIDIAPVAVVAPATTKRATRKTAKLAA